MVRKGCADEMRILGDGQRRKDENLRVEENLDVYSAGDKESGLYFGSPNNFHLQGSSVDHKIRSVTTY